MKGAGLMLNEIMIDRWARWIGFMGQGHAQVAGSTIGVGGI